MISVRDYVEELMARSRAGNFPQDAQKGRSARPQRMKKAEVEVKVE
jgi:hypothetical protein